MWRQSDTAIGIPPCPSGVYRTALGGLIALAAALGIGRFVYTPILPFMSDALGLDRSGAGVLASANFMGYLLGALCAAFPNLPGPRRRWLLGSLAASAITTASMGLGRSLVGFLVLRWIGGVASALVLVFASAMVLDHPEDPHRAIALALHFAGVGVGIAVSAILIGVLVRAGQPWQTFWLSSGLISLLATLAVARLVRCERGRRVPLRSTPRAIIDPGLYRLIAAYGLFGFGYVITATFLVSLLRAAPALRPLELVIWVVFGFAAAPSVAVWTWVATRVGTSVAFALACLTEAAGVLATAIWLTATGAVLGASLVGGTFMGLTALGLALARALTTGDPRRSLALMTGSFGLGQIVGPTFAGVVSDRLGSLTAPSIAAGAALLIAAALMRTCRG
jgi:predicted MFS family arabinose efflux permease